MRKVLIANRGEIAVRIIRACRDLGLQTVAVYSQADKEALHVLYADEAVCVGEPAATKSYLKIAHILSACEITGADAIHPGFGFLSENSGFASICESCGIQFIGPHHTMIDQLGNKAKAKSIAQQAKCPIIPGSNGVVNDPKEAMDIAEKIGYPVFIKASAGGGGKGIRIAFHPDEFLRHFNAAKAEAQASFGNPDIYLEKMIVNPRHIEIQVIGDQHGNYLHLGERDCTIQRRRQKLIEETPSPILTPSLRKKIADAAVHIVKSIGYQSVGTVEFLLDEKRNFYFMEVNTRIQVEHTITEEAFGVDLIKMQIAVAQGEKLKYKQKDLVSQGHIIQCRINAENPGQQFAPCPGVIDYFLSPGGPNVRVDTACYTGCRISPYYDSMIAKLIVRGKDRSEAINIMKRALKEFYIGGVKTTIPFHLWMLEDERFLQSQYSINYVDQLLSEGAHFGCL